MIFSIYRLVFYEQQKSALVIYKSLKGEHCRSFAMIDACVFAVIIVRVDLRFVSAPGLIRVVDTEHRKAAEPAPETAGQLFFTQAVKRHSQFLDTKFKQRFQQPTSFLEAQDIFRYIATVKPAGEHSPDCAVLRMGGGEGAGMWARKVYRSEKPSGLLFSNIGSGD